MSDRALQLKKDGNDLYRSGDLVGAESLYSKAIIADPRNPDLYSNRAMARSKLGMWDSVLTDSLACLALDARSMKACYHLTMAQYELRDFDAGLASAARARDLCVNPSDLSNINVLVGKLRRARWADRERRRTREDEALRREVVELLERGKAAALAWDDDGEKGGGEDINEEEHAAVRREVADEWDTKARRIGEIFDKASAETQRRTGPPEWMIDEISFDVMEDPVVTKTGKSYERATIMEHLRRQQTDPLTREPLRPDELRPNLNLKQACSEFLDANGWAVDW